MIKQEIYQDDKDFLDLYKIKVSIKNTTEGSAIYFDYGATKDNDLLTPDPYIIFPSEESFKEKVKLAVNVLKHLVNTLTDKEKEYHFE